MGSVLESHLLTYLPKITQWSPRPMASYFFLTFKQDNAILKAYHKDVMKMWNMGLQRAFKGNPNRGCFFVQEAK